jgi:hypothetical protein
MQLVRILFIGAFLSASTIMFAGIGGGSGNEVGGFGSDRSSAFSILTNNDPPPNPPGGFGDNPGDPESPDTPDITDAPLDGGSALLIAIGLGVGGRRIYKKIMNQ